MGRRRNAARCPVALVELGEAEASRFGHLRAQHVSRRYSGYVGVVGRPKAVTAGRNGCK